MLTLNFVSCTKEVKFIIPFSHSCIHIMIRLRVYCAQYGDQHALQIVIPLISLNRFVLVMKTQSTLDLSSKTVQIIGATRERETDICMAFGCGRTQTYVYECLTSISSLIESLLWSIWSQQNYNEQKKSFFLSRSGVAYIFIYGIGCNPAWISKLTQTMINSMINSWSTHSAPI